MFKYFWVTGVLLLSCSNVLATIPSVIGQWNGIEIQEVGFCAFTDEAPSTQTINITTQTNISPGTDEFTGTFSQTGNIFHGPVNDTFTGTIDDTGSWSATLDTFGTTKSGTYANGVFTVTNTSSYPSTKDPFATASCVVFQFADYTLSGGLNAVAPVIASNSAGTEIVAGNTQVLQAFVNNTVMPVVTRLQNIVVSILKPSLVSEGGRFNVSPVAGGYKLSAETGRAAGADLKNLAGWGSISMTNLENDNILTAYDGDRLAFQFGMDYMPKDNVVAGVSVGYEDIDVNTAFNLGSMDGQGFTIAPYIGAVLDDHWSVDAVIGYSSMEYDQVRLQGAIAGNPQITSSTDAERLFASANLNYTFSMNKEWLLIAKAGIMWAQETTDGFTERFANGTVAAINPEREAELTQGQIGADFTYLAGDKFEPYLSATYNYDFSSTSTTILTAGASNPFDDDDDVLLGAGFNYYADENSTASFEMRHRVARDDFEETIFSASYRSSF